ncbi:MAG: MBL fold metallo-hydrolase [Planctomycetia bacterium]|nr:MBL fold metallo-hydrolase [Planctomycetia bacterium]
MNHSLAQEMIATRLGNVFSSDRAVRRFPTHIGDAYQFTLRVLPYLKGFAYLIPMPDAYVPGAKTCEWLLVDSGCGDDDSNADLEAALRTVHDEFDPSFRPEKIKRIFLTHAHIDHFGGASFIQKLTKCDIWTHAFDSRVVTNYDDCARVENRRYAFFLRESGVPEEMISQVLEGFGFRPGRAKHVEVSRRLFGNERWGEAQFLYLPGHSPGCLALKLGALIFTGDVILSKTLTQIWPQRMTPQTGMVNYLRSLRKIVELQKNQERTEEPLLALPAHEEPIINLTERIKCICDGMNRRNHRLIRLLLDAEYPMTLLEIANQMYWTGRPNREFFALSDVASRVEFLLLNGRIDVAQTERLSDACPALLYHASLPNAKPTENTIQDVFGMDLACD